MTQAAPDYRCGDRMAKQVGAQAAKLNLRGEPNETARFLFSCASSRADLW